MEFLDRSLPNGSSMTYAWFEAMHTRMDVILWDAAATVSDFHTLCESIHAETLRVERMASCFLPDSEVSMVNASPAGRGVTLTDEMFEILERCISYNRKTEGLFDIAVSAECPGLRLEDKIRLDAKDRTAARQNENVRLNLSGFLKGYALDKAVEMVREAGINNALISFGNSSVYAVGNHPGGKGWPVATDEGNDYVLVDECLTTSGNGREDRRHIMNPLTGEYVEGKAMASVRTLSAEEGEVMSTVSFLKNNNTK